MLLPIPGRRVRRQLQHRAIDQAFRPRNKSENQVTRKKVLSNRHGNYQASKPDRRRKSTLAPAFAMSSSLAMLGMQTARDLLRSTN